MSTLGYRFMCDSCGTMTERYRFCQQCQMPMTMYSRTRRQPRRVKYI